MKMFFIYNIIINFWPHCMQHSFPVWQSFQQTIAESCNEEAGKACGRIHCKVGPPRIGIHNTSKGMNRYFLRI
jgi:hypothetical protein